MISIVTYNKHEQAGYPMKTHIIYTLKDGTEHSTKKSAIKHLDRIVGDLIQELAELMAHKNSSEIKEEMAHRGIALVHEISRAERYLEQVRRDISNYYIEELDNQNPNH